MKKILALLLLVSVSCQDKRVDRLEAVVENGLYTDTVLTNRIEKLEKHVVVQDSIIKVLASHAVHADSVTVTRQTKSDRAERRGRFLGGLLKTLIPIL